MDDIKSFKEKILTDKDFASKFKDVKDVFEAIDIAKENGYDFTNYEDKEIQQLQADLLESVAGGKKGDIDFDYKGGNVTNTGDDSTIGAFWEM